LICDEVLVLLPSGNEVVGYDAKYAAEDLGLMWNMAIGGTFDLGKSINTYIMRRTGDPNALPKLVAEGVFKAIGIIFGLPSRDCPR
jgi:hypothetical protein